MTYVDARMTEPDWQGGIEPLQKEIIRLRELVGKVIIRPRCDTCKHWVLSRWGYSECNLLYHNIQTNDDPLGVAFMAEPDFGCVKWEGK